MRGGSLARVRLKDHTPVYNIGITSRLTGLPIWTLRWIEKQGLVEPERTAGNQRLFSKNDVMLLERICELMDQKVNAAGIRIIVRLWSTGENQISHRARSGSHRAPGR